MKKIEMIIYSCKRYKLVGREQELEELVRSGKYYSEIAKYFGVTRAGISYYIKKCHLRRQDLGLPKLHKHEYQSTMQPELHKRTLGILGKGKGFVDANGYVWIWNKDSKKSVLEHRMIMEQYLGRPLLKYEIIHHINGIRHDNRIENLQVTTRKEHNKFYKDGYQEGLKAGIELKNGELEKQIRLLRWEIKQLRDSLQLKLYLGIDK